LTPPAKKRKKNPINANENPLTSANTRSVISYTLEQHILPKNWVIRVWQSMYTVLNRQNIGPCLSNPNAVSACARSQAIMYCEMHGTSYICKHEQFESPTRAWFMRCSCSIRSNHGFGLLGNAFLCLPKHISN
jgi:hypothetical protein